VNFLDSLIGFFDPRAGVQRRAYRNALDLMASQPQTRRYDAARIDRRTQNWQTTAASADLEVWRDLRRLRDRSRDLVRNNPYAASGVNQLVANLVGDGIEARAEHSDERLAALAQSAWNSWANHPVDGRHTFYTLQSQMVRGMIEGGNSLLVWTSNGKIPNSRVRALEGDWLDHTRTQNLANGNRVVNGIETDQDGNLVSYHLYPRHPGDVLGGWSAPVSSTDLMPSPSGIYSSTAVDARDVDHLYRCERIGQSLGVPWLAQAVFALYSIGELNDATLQKKRVEACLALVRRPALDDGRSALGEQDTQSDGQVWETLRPGGIYTARPGEDISVVNPSSSGDGDAFVRRQLEAVAASLGVPYHLLTGDVSQANYSSLRAATVAFWALLDDWLAHTILPHVCDAAWKRIMQREALVRNEPRLIEVTAAWTPPPRAWVDPEKDINAEIKAIRAGLTTMGESLSSRGKNWRDHVNDIATFNAAADAKNLALDTDPRRIDGRGQIQAPAGFLRPTAPTDSNP
jgi:lambda family phage portal protein